MSDSNFTRRGFLTTGLTLAAGALVGCGVTKVAEPTTANAEAEVAALPWAYEPLDAEAVRKRAYEYYAKAGCCYAVGAALVDSLAEKVGGPWKTIPTAMFNYGAGGAYGWGTLCGALNGGLEVVNMIAGADSNKVGNELIGWYTNFPFPTTKMDSYAKFPNQVTTVAHSPLCHISVSTWCGAAKAKVNGPEKKDRCAKLCGDVVVKIIELLNAQKDGKFAPEYKPADDFKSCLGCHNGKDSALDNEQGLMSCLPCHDDKAKGHP